MIISWRDLIPNWSNLLFLAIRVLFIAIVFEFIAWWAGRKIEAMAAPFLGLDANRDAKWRAARRATLKHAPKTAMRTLLYTAALIIICDAFHIPILPLSLAVGTVLLVIGAALLPMMRDYAQGFILLSEDTLAPGDVVEINGHQGQVEKWTLRATWIRDTSGRLHVLSNRDIKDVLVFRQAASDPKKTDVAFDPLAAPKALPK